MMKALQDAMDEAKKARAGAFELGEQLFFVITCLHTEYAYLPTLGDFFDDD